MYKWQQLDCKKVHSYRRTGMCISCYHRATIFVLGLTQDSRIFRADWFLATGCRPSRWMRKPYVIEQEIRNSAMTEAHRTEKDSLGEMRVPAGALYGAQTQRAVMNFPISGLRPYPAFVWAQAMIKRAAAEVNRDLGLL